MAYKGESSFGIIAILYTYQACKTIFGPTKLTNPSVRMAYKGQSSFGNPNIASIIEWYNSSHQIYKDTAH